jgi:hypothetical protein
LKSVVGGEKCLLMENLHSCARISTNSARKRNGKEVLTNYNKTRGHQHDRWMELKEVLRVQTHAEV